MKVRMEGEGDEVTREKGIRKKRVLGRGRAELQGEGQGLAVKNEELVRDAGYLYNSTIKHLQKLGFVFSGCEGRKDAKLRSIKGRM